MGALIGGHECSAGFSEAGAGGCKCKSNFLFDESNGVMNARYLSW